MANQSINKLMGFNTAYWGEAHAVIERLLKEKRQFQVQHRDGMYHIVYSGLKIFF